MYAGAPGGYSAADCQVLHAHAIPPSTRFTACWSDCLQDECRSTSLFTAVNMIKIDSVTMTDNYTCGASSVHVSKSSNSPNTSLRFSLAAKARSSTSTPLFPSAASTGRQPQVSALRKHYITPIKTSKRPIKFNSYHT